MFEGGSQHHVSTLRKAIRESVVNRGRIKYDIARTAMTVQREHSGERTRALRNGKQATDSLFLVPLVGGVIQRVRALVDWIRQLEIQRQFLESIAAVAAARPTRIASCALPLAIARAAA